MKTSLRIALNSTSLNIRVKICKRVDPRLMSRIDAIQASEGWTFNDYLANTLNATNRAEELKKPIKLINRVK